MTEDSLIEHLKKAHPYIDSTNFNLLDFVSGIGNPLDAIAYSKLFWPDFIEIEGMIFLKDFIEDEERSRIYAALSTMNAKEIEVSFNQFLVPQSFFARHYITSEEENLYLAQQIVLAWQARLKQLFPNKRCVVELELPEQHNEGPTIIVYQAE